MGQGAQGRQTEARGCVPESPPRTSTGARCPQAEVNEILSRLLGDEKRRRALRSTWCVCRRRERGSGGAPMSTRWPRTGSDRRRETPPRHRGSSMLVSPVSDVVSVPRVPHGDRELGRCLAAGGARGGASNGLELQHASRPRRARSCVDPPRAPLPAARRRHGPRRSASCRCGMQTLSRPRPADSGSSPRRTARRVFNPRTPHSVNTFLVDGVRWPGRGSHQKGRGEGRARSAGCRRTVRSEVEAKAERLAAFHS